ncbi:hypothetical protein [Streptomyces sp. B5E4]|uniref:hypothetical protein n=1 Tax=Streptomyces sp. B5E4 TaxID=3153568 RepID=UPI00325E2D6A
MWQADLTVIERELTPAAGPPGTEALREEATREHGEALRAARGAGRVPADAVARV